MWIGRPILAALTTWMFEGGMMTFYETNYGPVIIPGLAVWQQAGMGGHPVYLDYLKFVSELAGHAWRRRGRLKIAPPFYAWVKATGRLRQLTGETNAGSDHRQ